MTLKEQLKRRVLEDLENYLVEMNEHEDEETLNNTSLEERVRDFYVYQFHKD